MPKPPTGMPAKTRTKPYKSIVPHNSAPAQPIFTTPPELPEQLDRYLDEPFDHQKSIELDRWLAYIAAEFEGVRS